MGNCWPCHKSIEADLYKNHIIVDKLKCRMWSPVSRTNDTLIKQNNDNSVSCNGDFTSIEGNTVIEAEAIIRRRRAPRFAFKFQDNGQYMKAEDAGLDEYTVTTVKVDDGKLPPESIFDVDYYWGYTVFKNVAYRRYLGCNVDGSVRLLELKSVSYPNPQCLFIVNEVK